MMKFIVSSIHYYTKWGWFFDSERKQVNENTIMTIKQLNSLKVDAVDLTKNPVRN